MQGRKGTAIPRRSNGPPQNANLETLLLVTNARLEAMTNLLVSKGVITRQDVLANVRQVYQDTETAMLEQMGELEIPGAFR